MRSYNRLLLLFALMVFAGTIASSQEMLVGWPQGTWKLNLERSEFLKGPRTENEVLTVTESTLASQKWQVQVLHTGSDPLNISFSGAVDGTFYPIVGDPAHNVFAFLKDGGWQTKDSTGKVVQTGTITLSPDHNTLTMNMINNGPQGEVKTVHVWNRIK